MADIDFQPIDFTPEEQPSQPKSTSSINFQPESNQPPTSGISFQPETPPTNDQAASTEQNPPEVLKDEDIAHIAQKYGVDPFQLKSIAPYQGAITAPASFGEAVTQGLKGAAGFAGRSLLFNAPQKFYAQQQSPQMQQAIQELQDIGRKQQNVIGSTAELVANPIAGAGGGALARVGTSAGIGALQGYGESKPGEEVSGTAKGAAFGGALGVGAEALGGLIKFMSRPSAHPQALADIDKIGNEQLAAKAQSEKLMEEPILNRELPDYTPEEYTTIAKEQLPQDDIDKYLDPTTDEGQRIREQIGDTNPNESDILEQLGKNTAENRYMDFARDISDEKITTPGEALEVLQTEQRQGPEYLANRYREFSKAQLIDDYLERTGVTDVDRMGSLGKTGLRISDAQFALRQIDEPVKLDAEDALNKLSISRNLANRVKMIFRKDLDELGQAASKVGLVDDLRNPAGGNVYKMIDTGNYRVGSGNERDIATRVRQEFENRLQWANEKAVQDGVKTFQIPRIQNYIHQVTVPRPQIQARVTNELSKAADEAGKILRRDLPNLAAVTKQEFERVQESPAVKNLIEFVNMGEADTIIPKSGSELVARTLDSIGSEPGVMKLEKTARGMQQRTGEIPDFIREKNIFKVLDRYTHDLITNLYQREPLDRLRRIADHLDTVKMTPQADYIRRLIQDTQGIRTDSVAGWGAQVKRELGAMLEGRIQEAARKGDTVTLKALGTISDMGGLPYYLSRQLYPNVLGWSPHSVLMHAASSIARIIPELGNVYGSYTYLRGLAYSALNLRSTIKYLKDSGLIATQHNRAGERWLLDGIASSAPVHYTKEATEALGRVAMAGFEGSELLNRAAIVGCAKAMANDLVNGNSMAQKSLREFPSFVQRNVAKAAGNEQQIFRILNEHLNSTTMFNYNRPTLFEYGRTMGPIFTTFTKWPTAIAGEAIANIRNKGLSAGSRKVAIQLSSPLLAYAAIGEGLKHLGADPEESARTKLIVGSHGYSGLAPVEALGHLGSGGIFVPPVINSIVNSVIKPAGEIIKHGDINDPSTITGPIGKGLDAAAFMYTPNASYLKFLGDTLPTLLQGERPEGTTETERIGNGLGAYRK